MSIEDGGGRPGRDVLSAIAWAENCEREILARGRVLTPAETADAVAMGVRAPQRVRVLVVDAIAAPADDNLQALVHSTGLFSGQLDGLTPGYGIYIVRGRETRQLISHECRHVYQCESAGSIAAFIPQYLDQVLSLGYARAPFEIDAYAHEIRD
jgi:sorbitol-specific phosphotransferase system component IIA